MSFGLSASLSLEGSGSHIDKIGIERDASNAALAGSIISGSKMQETVNESSHKRHSVSSGPHSETASTTISFTERCSTNISLGDNASTRALAGSIANYKDSCIGTSSSGASGSKTVSPVEVHAIESDSQYSEKNFLSNNCHCEDALSTKSAKLLDTRKECRVAGSKCVSFQTGTKCKLNKYESRSYDQLANYCMICDGVHRPCCPVYELSLKQADSRIFSSSQGATKPASVAEKPFKAIQSLYSGQFNFFRRKESIKSTVSDTSPSPAQEKKESQRLKRVKSSDASKSNNFK